MTRRAAIALVFVALGGQAAPGAAAREWQTGTWREVKVERPRVRFGVRARDPNGTLPGTTPVRETRIYLIETDAMRLELRQDATVDTPWIDVQIGESVTFAIEKKTAYIKDEDGREHRLRVARQSALPSAKTK